MAKIQIGMYIDVEVEEEDGHSWDALKEGFEIIKSALEKDLRITNSYYEGISKVYE